jgi:ATP-dependent Clp protease protease subunit
MDETMNNRFNEDLLNKRTIYLCGEINPREANRVGKLVLWLNAKSEVEPITLYITSGGCVDSGMDLYDIIRDSKAPIQGKVYRMAASMAAVVLQACRPRFALKHAEITIHNMTVRKAVSELEEEFEKTMGESKRMQQEIYEIFSLTTGKTVEEIKQKCKEDKAMTAEEAKTFGLLDEVV